MNFCVTDDLSNIIDEFVCLFILYNSSTFSVNTSLKWSRLVNLMQVMNIFIYTVILVDFVNKNKYEYLHVHVKSIQIWN